MLITAQDDRTQNGTRARRPLCRGRTLATLTEAAPNTLSHTHQHSPAAQQSTQHAPTTQNNVTGTPPTTPHIPPSDTTPVLTRQAQQQNILAHAAARGSTPQLPKAIRTRVDSTPHFRQRQPAQTGTLQPPQGLQNKRTITQTNYLRDRRRQH